MFATSIEGRENEAFLNIMYTRETSLICNFRLFMVNYIILYKKFVEHHKLFLILFYFVEDIFNKINLITWCSTNFLYKIRHHLLTQEQRYHVVYECLLSSMAHLTLNLLKACSNETNIMQHCWPNNVA